MTVLRPILLVEDNVDDAELIQRALKRARLVNPIVWVEHGERALAYLRREGAYAQRPNEPPLFILLDVKLPGISGPEVLTALRADPDPALRVVPVVMLTSSNQERDRYASYRSGANAYVVKPVDFTQLQDTVQTLGYFWGILNQPPP